METADGMGENGGMTWRSNGEEWTGWGYIDHIKL